jgi:hypothetical protein
MDHSSISSIRSIRSIRSMRSIRLTPFRSIQLFAAPTFLDNRRDRKLRRPRDAGRGAAQRGVGAWRPAPAVQHERPGATHYFTK